MTQQLRSTVNNGRKSIPWTHSDFGKLMMEILQHPELRKIPLEDFGAKDTRPALCYDLVHLNEAGWGGLMALMMLAPSNFQTSFWPLPLPEAKKFDCQYACVLIGTNDAMSMCAPKAWIAMFKTVKGLEKAPDGGPLRLPEDWAKTCCPSADLFEKNL